MKKFKCLKNAVISAMISITDKELAFRQNLTNKVYDAEDFVKSLSKDEQDIFCFYLVSNIDANSKFQVGTFIHGKIGYLRCFEKLHFSLESLGFSDAQMKDFLKEKKMDPAFFFVCFERNINADLYYSSDRNRKEGCYLTTEDELSLFKSRHHDIAFNQYRDTIHQP